MRIGDSGGSWLASPETQSRETTPLSLVGIHSRRSLTSGRDRKNEAKMVSTWQFHPMKGNGLYGRVRVLRAGRIESRAAPPPMISNDGWGFWSLAIVSDAVVLTWTAEILAALILPTEISWTGVNMVGRTWRKGIRGGALTIGGRFLVLVE